MSSGGPGGAPMTKAELEQSKKEVMSRMGISLPGGIDGGLAELVGDEMDAEGDADAAAAADGTDGLVKSEPPAGEDLKPDLSTPSSDPSSATTTTTTAAAATELPKKAVPRGKRQREQFEKEEERRVREAEDEAFRGLSARQINALKRKRKAGGGAAVVPGSATKSAPSSLPRAELPSGRITR